ncbi:YaeQ family protein [Corallincola platygyrae]|uniref:YaeQ family protein n=1 Tax=Corallincola platygyrae TaxID=1193278 RepID=A0ABW4XK73_9GAMM
MALKATINKANLEVSDLRRHHYHSYPLTVAQHPSENARRTMLRLLAFALHADEQLQFTRGLCVDEEPELWLKTLSDEITLWIELGLPDFKRLKKACRKAEQVVLYAYGSAFSVWWPENQSQLASLNNLEVIYIPEQASEELAALLDKNMQLQCTIDEEQVWFSTPEQSLSITPETYQTAND